MRQGCASMGLSCATATTKDCDTFATWTHVDRELPTSSPAFLHSHDTQLWLNETAKRKGKVHRKLRCPQPEQINRLTGRQSIGKPKNNKQRKTQKWTKISCGKWRFLGKKPKLLLARPIKTKELKRRNQINKIKLNTEKVAL